MYKKQQVINKTRNSGDTLAAQARADRLIRARALAGFRTPREVTDKYGDKYAIKYGGWRGWEQSIGSGLSQKGAEKACKILREENVVCSADWLMHKIGPGPKLISDFNYTMQQSLTNLVNDELTDNQAIIDELLLFKKHHPENIDHIIKDDTMLPFYQIGDYVAGIKVDGEKAVGKNCIVQTIDGQLMVRKIRNKTGNTYTLECLNHNADKPIEYNVELDGVAVIIWWRSPLGD
ncbi:MAG: hypothetical protein AAGA27_03420 [Pseudomonadota bacterium]